MNQESMIQYPIATSPRPAEHPQFNSLKHYHFVFEVEVIIKSLKNPLPMFT
jgi:hypothetical protein